MVFKWWLAKHKWYRRWKGGIWFRVRVRIPEHWIYWNQDGPCEVEDVLDIEDYATLKVPVGAKLR